MRRPTPGWVGLALALLLDEHAAALEGEAAAARAVAARLAG